MRSMAGVSDITMPLGIQKFGARAARPAATSPTHGPATARPSRPTQSTVPAPSTAMVIRCNPVPWWTPKGRVTPPRISDVSGGWAAVGAVPNGVRKNCPCASPLPVTPYQKES